MRKAKKTVSTSSAKTKAWKAFSRYIRMRDAIETTGTTTHARCCTCGTVYPISGVGCLQAGHFIAGRVNSILFDERGVHAQCLTKESKLRMFNGENRSIAKIRVGDSLWAFNEKTYEHEQATVLNVSSFVPDTLYEVEMNNGTRFYATGDHKVVANKKWKTIKQMLHRVSAYDIMTK